MSCFQARNYLIIIPLCNGKNSSSVAKASILSVIHSHLMQIRWNSGGIAWKYLGKKRKKKKSWRMTPSLKWTIFRLTRLKNYQNSLDIMICVTNLFLCMHRYRKCVKVYWYKSSELGSVTVYYENRWPVWSGKTIPLLISVWNKQQKTGQRFWSKLKRIGKRKNWSKKQTSSTCLLGWVNTNQILSRRAKSLLKRWPDKK